MIKQNNSTLYVKLNQTTKLYSEILGQLNWKGQRLR